MQTVVVDSIAKGVKFLIEHPIEKYRAQGGGETEFLKEFMRLLQPTDVVFDIGASIGAWSVYCAPLCKKVYAFEPDPELFHATSNNVKINGLVNVEVFPYAISDNSNGLTLFTSGRGGVSPSVFKRGELVREVCVRTDTMDAIVQRGEAMAPSVLKIDIEGAEFLALSGAINILQNVRLICLEMHPKQMESLGHSENDVLNLLREFEVIHKVECSNSWNGDHLMLKRKIRHSPEFTCCPEVYNREVLPRDAQSRQQQNGDITNPDSVKPAGLKAAALEDMGRLLVDLNGVESRGLTLLWEDCERNYLPERYLFLSHQQILREAIAKLKQNSKPPSWIHFIASGLLKFYLPSLDLPEQKTWLRKFQFLLYEIEEKLLTQNIEDLDISHQYLISAFRYYISDLYINENFLQVSDRRMFADFHATLVRMRVWQLGCLDAYDIDQLNKINEINGSLNARAPLKHAQYFPFFALMLYRNSIRIAKTLDSDTLFSSYLNTWREKNGNMNGTVYDSRSLAKKTQPQEYALWYVENYEEITRYWNRHKGESCFIIGNGPSLKNMDLSPLRHRVTFGLNKIYLLFDKLGFETDYLVAANPYVTEQAARELSGLSMPQFIAMWGRAFVQKRSNVMFLRENNQTHFVQDITQGVCIDCTVTYMAMQIAFYMGFKTVVLIGVDHSFQSQGSPHKTVQLDGVDLNHFDPNYFGYGKPWQLPDLAGSERAYSKAKTVFEADGRQIVDATVDGKLQIFPKISYEEALNLTKESKGRKTQ